MNGQAEKRKSNRKFNIKKIIMQKDKSQTKGSNSRQKVQTSDRRFKVIQKVERQTEGWHQTDGSSSNRRINHQTVSRSINLTRKIKHALTNIKTNFRHYNENKLKRQRIIWRPSDEKPYIAEAQSSKREKDSTTLIRTNKPSYEKTWDKKNVNYHRNMLVHK